MKVLFVCLGNICRSPTAEAVFRHQAQAAGLEQRIHIDSAGTADWHRGKSPDSRSCQFASRRGYDLEPLRARQVSVDDFHDFDLILAMDHDNLAHLRQMQPTNARAELDLFLKRYGLPRDAVPDPYYGGDDGFEDVLDLVEQASAALLNEIKARL